MTPDELKKYKKQIEMLKRDFHKENPDNIETSNTSANKVEENKLDKPKSVLEKLKQIDNTSGPKGEILAQKKEKVFEVSKSVKNTSVESIKQSTENVKQYAENKVSNIKTNTEQASYTTNKEQQITKPVQEQNIDKKQISNVNIEQKQTEKLKENPPIVPPIVNNENKENEEEKSSILKYILLLLLLLLLGFAAYYFYNKNKENKKAQQQISLEKKQYEDSVLAFEQEKIKQEIEDKYNEDNLELDAPILIADTIYQLISPNPEGIYAVIGSYSELKNAKILKKKQNTGYESYIFDTDKIRVGLKISTDETQIFEDLNEIKTYYPDAWLLNNKN